MLNLYNGIIYHIDKYCIKHEDDKILDHTHNISIDDVRSALRHLYKCKYDCTDGTFYENYIIIWN